MKLALKMILSTVLVVCISLTVTAYLLVQSSFSTLLNNRIESATEESRQFCMMLGALSLGQMGLGTEPIDAVQAALSSSSALKEQRYFIEEPTSERTFRNELISSDALSTDLLEAGSDTICYQIGKNGTGYEITTLSSFSLNNTVFYVTLQRNLSDVYALRSQSLRQCRIIVIIAIAAGSLISALFAALLTRPLHRLSRSTKQIAGGLYSKRANVSSKDEIGEFARDFNSMADSLESKIEELADAAQRQKDFTASFAHELKTPLTSVIGYADTLRSRALSPEHQMNAANYIFTEGKRLEAMSRSLLDLFALEKAAPVMHNVPAEQIADAVAESTASIMQEKNITLQLQAQPATLKIEPELIKTLLYNLLDNARKASEPNSSIDLIGSLEENGYRFTVRDHGRGIPADALARITEPFYMVDKSRSRSEGGAGLGLALCQRIAQAHHTALQYESEEGVGTTVSFLLEVSAE
ncbi:MAG: HAMP domain-containing histidine kinase [Ruminococcaceae bacterium]|nr:HAMP domain-containing histidine kinase [Oscillospiraceae bacterium]